MQLPEPLPDTTVVTGQPVPVTEQAQQLIAAVDEALAQQATSYRDDSPVPVVGTAPPVPQPGRPPMSQRATDASALMLSGGAASLLVGGAASLVMVASGYADPVVCGIVTGAPAVLVLALSRLVGRAKDVLPAEHHHHYKGPVYQDQRSTTNQTKAVIANIRNQTPQ